MKKKGDFRKVTRVEITQNRGVLKAGTVTEMHPVLAKTLIIEGVAKKSNAELTRANVNAPTSNIISRS